MILFPHDLLKLICHGRWPVVIYIIMVRDDFSILRVNVNSPFELGSSRRASEKIEVVQFVECTSRSSLAASRVA